MKENKKTNKIKTIKEFLSDKRNKALVKLGFWLIFFIFVVIYIRFTNSNNRSYVNSDPIENLPLTITLNVAGTFSQVFPKAMATAISVDPMPVAKADNAPEVQV